ncbi:MAG: hypothetical protein AB7G87_01990 [Clostridia bacterium]
MTRTSKYISLIMMLIGTYLLVKNQAILSVWVEALIKNAGLMTLLLSVPLLSIIFHFEDFSSCISNFASKHINTSFKFYMFTLILAHLLGIILNMAAIPMVNKLLENISKYYPKKMFYKALTRGFVLAKLWSPSFMAVAVSLQYSGLQWYMYAPFGILLSVVGIAMTLITTKITVKETENNCLKDAEINNKNQPDNSGGLIKTVVIAASLLILIICFQYLSGQSILVVIPLVSIVFPIFLAALLKKFSIFKARFKDYFNTTLPHMNNEIVLFTAVGFLGYALNISGLDKYINLIITSIGIQSAIIFIIVIISLIFILSMIGLDPILSISAISIAYSAGAIPLSQLQLAAIFSVGYFGYTICSPFSGLALTLCGLRNENPLDVCININLVFYIMFICVSSLVIAMIP